MDILPAIDLKEGFAVRLSKGVMQSAKIYSKEPLDVAKEFQDFGIKWLHIVDLDGAFVGQKINHDVIEKIASKTSLKIEVGGGIRDEKSIKSYIESGVDRVILGSTALNNIELTKKLALSYPIVVGIDAIDGMVAVEGWADVSRIEAGKLAAAYKESSIVAIICTDISKDGMLSGINVGFTQQIAKLSAKTTIASGGVSGIEDIILAKKNNIDGVIIGKAYYEGRINLKEALKVAND